MKKKMSGAWDDASPAGVAKAAPSNSASKGPSLFFGLGMKREVTESLLRTRIEEVAPVAAMEMKSGGMCAVVTFFNSKDAERVRKALGNSTIRSTRIVVNDAFQAHRSERIGSSGAAREQGRWNENPPSQHATHQEQEYRHTSSRAALGVPNRRPSLGTSNVVVDDARPVSKGKEKAPQLAPRPERTPFMSCSNLPRLGAHNLSPREDNGPRSRLTSGNGHQLSKGPSSNGKATATLVQNSEFNQERTSSNRKRPRHSED